MRHPEPFAVILSEAKNLLLFEILFSAQRELREEYLRQISFV
jgi:hypothetical protein